MITTTGYKISSTYLIKHRNIHVVPEIDNNFE